MTRGRFWLQAEPTEYLLHFRRGRLIREGMGLGVLCLPAIDRCCIVPCTANSLSFEADQVTRENQGVEVSGFAVWRIATPRVTAERFAFAAGADPLAVIGADLRSVVESAIRHCVANMTVDEVLRKRGTIILELKRELDFISAQWGLGIDTIEIRSVKILSTQVFNQLQAQYREALRLVGETAALETEREVALRRLAQAEELTQREHEAAVRKAERAHELALRRIELERDAAIATDRAQHDALDARGDLEQARRALSLLGKRHERELGAIDAEIAAGAARAQNEHRADLRLIAALPSIAREAKFGEITVTPEVIGAIARALARATGAAS